MYCKMSFKEKENNNDDSDESDESYKDKKEYIDSHKKKIKYHFQLKIGLINYIY